MALSHRVLTLTGSATLANYQTALNPVIAATWASMVRMGRQGYLDKAQKIFDTSLAMQEAVRSHPQLRMLGTPTFLFSFTSDDFDIEMFARLISET